VHRAGFDRIDRFVFFFGMKPIYAVFVPSSHRPASDSSSRVLLLLLVGIIGVGKRLTDSSFFFDFSLLLVE